MSAKEKNTVETTATEEIAPQPLKKPDMEELVEYTAPLLPGAEKQDILVGVNGELIRLQRGATVQIKRKFVEALNNANRQEMEAYQTAQEARL